MHQTLSNYVLGEHITAKIDTEGLTETEARSNFHERETKECDSVVH